MKSSLPKSIKYLYFIDSTTRGLRHILDGPTKYFLDEFKIICISRTKFDERYKEFSDNLIYVTMPYVNPHRFSHLLIKYPPSGFIFLSLSTKFLQSLLLLAKGPTCPIILLAHGSPSVANVISRQPSDFKSRYISKIKKIFSFIFIYDNFIFLRINIRSKSSFTAFFRDNLSKLLGKHLPVSYLTDLITDSIHYSELDAQIFNKFSNTHEKSHIAANPDIIRYGEVDCDQSSENIIKSNTVVYLDSYAFSRTFGSNSNKYFLYMKRIKEVLMFNELNLCLLLHPSSLRNQLLLSILDDCNICYMSTTDGIRQLRKSLFVIADPSSVALTVGFHKQRILYSTIDPYTIGRYGPAIVTYPYSYSFSSFSELSSLINNSIMLPASQKNTLDALYDS